MSLLPPLCLAALVALSTTSVFAQSSDWVGDEFSRARLITAQDSVGPDGTITVGVEIEMQEGWKTYWRSPGEGGLPPAFDWKASKNLQGGTVSWPIPKRYTQYGLDNFIYTERVVLPVAFKVTDPAKAANIALVLDYAVCADLCVPAYAKLAMTLPAGDGSSGEHADRLTSALAAVPLDAGPDTGIEILSAETMTKGDKSYLVIETGGFAADHPKADIFVEAGNDFLFGTPVIRTSAEHDHQHSIYVPITWGKAKNLAGVQIRVTLAGKIPVEAKVTVAPLS